MSRTSTMPVQPPAADPAVAAATAGDRAAFDAIAARHRRELHVHCYRMLGSFDEAEDLVQETFLRAWRRRSSYEGRAPFRAWLYRIATNACLDALKRRPVPAAEPGAFEVPWLQPYPDALLEDLPSADPGPEAAAVTRETIELAFLVAIQRLSPAARAVLILRDVLNWPASETAAVLELSVAAANSHLQRARAALREHLGEPRLEWTPGADATEAERELLRRYVDATERADGQALAVLMREDARFAMPPQPAVYTGRDRIVESWAEGGFGSPELGDLRCRVTRANRQPAVACYVRRPGDDRHRPMSLDVLRIEGGAVAEILTFPPGDFEAFGLPSEL